VPLRGLERIPLRVKEFNRAHLGILAGVALCQNAKSGVGHYFGGKPTPLSSG
jgi:hypothetical protein